MKIDWSKYARCRICAAPEGGACKLVDGTEMKMPHVNRTKAPLWGLYGDCPVCSAAPGKKCVDMRYALRTGSFNMDRPHKRRPKL